MNIEKDLKKDGISVIGPLDALNVTLISKFVSERLVANFPFCGFNYEKLYLKISNIPMYVADIPDTVGVANYFFKNGAIYFKSGISIDAMKKYAVHEFIHAYQEVKDKKNILYRLGLCDFTGFKVYGMALNEAAVQLMASKAIGQPDEQVKYFDIELTTNTPDSYTIICTLVKQLGYIIGENTLYDSTLNSNMKFIKAFISICGENIFFKLQDNLDELLDLEIKVNNLSFKLERKFLSNIASTHIQRKIYKYKSKIKKLFFDTQNLIISSYFNKTFNNLYTEQEVEEYRKKLYNFKDLIGTNEKYTYFNDFYINMMYKLDQKINEINNYSYGLIPYRRNLISLVFAKLSSLTNLGNYSENIQ